jgi:hypothetical protein
MQSVAKQNYLAKLFKELGSVVISWSQAKTVDFPCPNRFNKGLKPLAPHDLATVESGFWVK